MKEKNVLIAESGSTKTDWCLLTGDRKKQFTTQGIHPYFLQSDDIVSILKQEIKAGIRNTPLHEIHFYGAGISSKDNGKIIEKSLTKLFNASKIETYSDMLASARATCQHSKGIACILGTGSNSCFYNGKKIGFKTRALGFVLGDEGGASYLGKKVLQYYLHGIFDRELISAFDQQFQTDADTILHQIYKGAFPNRYLAQFARFLADHRGHYMIENIAEDGLNDFFINHLLRYPRLSHHAVHFTGSVAWHFQDIIKALCVQYEINCGTILQKPMKGLITFHQNKKDK